MWTDFGFQKNPYDTHPVKGNAEGEKLLVGRSTEIRNLKNRIKNFNHVVSLEGPNGVGKTSLVLVAGYILEKETENLKKNSLLLLPEPLQLPNSDQYESFKRNLYSQIASYFISNEARLTPRLDLQVNLQPLRQWLEQPMHYQGGATFAGFGANGGQAANTASGFDQHGFYRHVDNLLNQAFDENGGLICIIDNLELLNTSQAARNALEIMRDDLLNKPGLKWVICGARGIVKSVASSSRLQGRIQEPIQIKPLNKSSISDLIRTRVELYATRSDATPPVGNDSFTYLFGILNENLRDSLKFSGDFSSWLYETDQSKSLTNDKAKELFEIWLDDQSEQFFKSMDIQPRAWQLFDEICNKGGIISPSDYESFGFNTSQAMRGQISPLENVELISSEIDETDQRRRNISVTAKGWLIQHHRAQHNNK